MEISLAGIEQAVEGLGYRSDKSPKSRLIYTLRKRYLESGAIESVTVIETDTLIDSMWELGGDAKAIRSKRKNLSSIKSSVNVDLNNAWEDGRNPEGITIGPLNTFVMSDAAKDKILSSFSGNVNLEGGDSLDRVSEALKIVSEYLSNLPRGLEDDKLSNLKSLVEGLAEQFGEATGPGEFEITAKRKEVESGVVERAGDGLETEINDEVELLDGEEELLEEEMEIAEIAEEDFDEYKEVTENDSQTFDPDEMEIVEVLDEEGVEDEHNGNSLLDEEEPLEDETELNEIVEDDMEDTETEADEIEALEPEAPDEVELVDEDEVIEDVVDGEELPGDATEIEEIIESDPEVSETETDEIEALEPEALDEVELVDEQEMSEDEIENPEALEPDDMEIVDAIDKDDSIDDTETVELSDDEEIIIDGSEDIDILEDDAEIEGADEAEEGDFDEVLGEDIADYDEDDAVEVMDEVDISEFEETDILENEEILDETDIPKLEDVDVLEDDDVLDETDEAEGADTEDDTEPDEKIGKNDVGLPLDQLAEDALNFDEFQPDEEQKRLLAERFDGYLGAMERFYNQYIIIKKGNYIVGADDTEEDALRVRNVSLPDFYIGKYSITNALFEVFIERTGYKTTAEKLGFGYVYQGRFQKTVDPKTGLAQSTWNPIHTRKKIEGANWYQPTGPGSTLHRKRNHPVVQVSMRDARTFAAWTGKRLPTEIEWEASARTRSGFIFPWGNDWKDGCCNLENSGLSDTSPVDEYLSGVNEAGLGDLLGNVLEWTADECEAKYPQEKNTKFFIAKGGSWVNREKTPLYIRTRFEVDFTANILGFRCIAD